MYVCMYNSLQSIRICIYKYVLFGFTSATSVMMKTASIVVMVAAMAAALPSVEDRDSDSLAANQLFDGIVDKAVENIA